MHARRCFCALLLTCLLTALTACKDQRRHELGAGLELSTQPACMPADADPLQVARAALTAIADAQAARAGGLGSTHTAGQYDDAMARLAALSAKNQIHQEVVQLGGMHVPRSITADGALTLITENWVSALAHYTRGYNWDSLRYRAAPGDTSARVYVEAGNPSDRDRLAELTAQSPSAGEQALRDKAIAMGFNIPITAGIDLHLVRVDGQWRILRIELGPAIAIPATAPAPVQSAG